MENFEHIDVFEAYCENYSRDVFRALEALNPDRAHKIVQDLQDAVDRGEVLEYLPENMFGLPCKYKGLPDALDDVATQLRKSLEEEMFQRISREDAEAVIRVLQISEEFRMVCSTALLYWSSNFARVWNESHPDSTPIDG